MKATGIVRKVDELGRVVLPIEIRRNMGINEGDSLEIFVSDGHEITLRKYKPGCYTCGEIGDLVDVLGLPLCRTCIESYHKALNILKKEAK